MFFVCVAHLQRENREKRSLREKKGKKGKKKFLATKQNFALVLLSFSFFAATRFSCVPTDRERGASSFVRPQTLVTFCISQEEED